MPVARHGRIDLYQKDPGAREGWQVHQGMCKLWGCFHSSD